MKVAGGVCVGSVVASLWLKAEFSDMFMQKSCVFPSYFWRLCWLSSSFFFYGGRGEQLHLCLIFWYFVSLTWPDFILGNACSALNRCIRREHANRPNLSLGTVRRDLSFGLCIELCPKLNYKLNTESWRLEGPVSTVQRDGKMFIPEKLFLVLMFDRYTCRRQNWRKIRVCFLDTWK